MRQNLPALPRRALLEPVRPGELDQHRGRVQRWFRTPLGAAISGIAPELLRYAADAARLRRSPAPLDSIPSSGINSVSVSEVEIDVASPLVRRIVVRSTNAWSMAPELVLASQERRRRGRVGLGALSVAGLTVLTLAAIRRAPQGLPLGRIRD